MYETESCLETITWYMCTEEEDGDFGFEELFGNERSNYWSLDPACVEEAGSDSDSDSSVVLIDDSAEFYDHFCRYLERMYELDNERYVDFADVTCEGGIGPLDVWDSDIETAQQDSDSEVENFTFDVSTWDVDNTASESDSDYLQWSDVEVQAGKSFALTFSRPFDDAVTSFEWRTDPVCSYMWYDESDSDNDQRLHLYFTDYYECLGNNMLLATGFVALQSDSEAEEWIGVQTFTIDSMADTDDEMRITFYFEETAENTAGEEETTTIEAIVNVKVAETV